MNDILEFYANEAKACETNVTWFKDRQARALDTFRHRSFPTRADEDWKYLRLDDFLEQRFSKQSAGSTSLPACKTSSPALQKTSLGQWITLYNGEVCLPEGLQDTISRGLIVAPILQALETHTEKLKPWLGKLLTTEHGFHALNMAALQTGLFIYVPPNVHLSAPLLISYWQDQANSALYSRTVIVMGEGASATVVEHYAGAADVSYCNNTITEAHLAVNSQLRHYKIQQESKAAYHFGHLAVQQDASSHCESHSLNLGAKVARSDLTLTFLAKEAHCLLNGIYLPTDGQMVDHHTSVHHLVPSCSSIQNYKGVLTGKSQAIFNGKILVGEGAVHTDAAQVNKNLLLSSQAQVDTKPQLEIYADDVRCTHGATVGQLDEDALFYMRSRGLSQEEATSLLIQAFTAENTAMVTHKGLGDWMAELIEAQWRN